MELAKVLISFLLLSLCLNTPAGAYETDRIVPSGPNPDEPPASLPSPKKPRDLKFKRLAFTIPNTFDSHANINRVVPSGPNPQQSPDSPSRYVDRLVPGGPNPQQSPDSPSRPFESQFNGFEQSPPAL